MADATIRIKVDANTQEARVIKRELDDLGKSGDRAAKSTDKLAMSTKLLTGAIIGLGGALSLGQFAKLADTITNINTQLGNVTKSAGEFDRAFESLFKVAQNTGTEFTAVVDTFTRLNVSLPESLKQTTDLSKTVELLARGFAASGTEAQAARGAITQLTQGLASNFQASAQEINSLIDAAPLLAKVIAEELGGKAAVDLKRFAEQGTLTAESFLRALESAEASINAFAIPPTIEKAVIRLRNEFLLFASESDTLRIASEKLANAINFLAGNLDNVFKIMGVALGAAIPALIVAFATSLPAAITATTAAFTALTAVIAANPFGAIAVAISATISAFFLFRKEIFNALDDVKIFGVDVTDVFFTIKNTAIEIFKGLADILTLPFKLAFNAINNTVRSIQLLYNKIPGLKEIPVNDFISQTGTISDTFSNVGGIGGRIVQRTANDIISFDNRNLRAPELPQTPSVLGTSAPSVVAGAVSGLTQEIDKAKGKTQELDTAFGNLANDIERELAGAFKDAFSAGTGFFSRFADGLKSTFKNAISEIAFQAAKPIFLNIVAGVTGGIAGGSASSALASSLGGSTGGGLGSLGQLLSLGRNALKGLNTPIFGADSLIGGGINKIGSVFGLGNAASSFTPAAGLAGFGGNFLANSLFGGDRGIGSSIGGTIGGIAGTVFGGPIGAALGSFAGNAIGGLFGGRSTPSGAVASYSQARGGRLAQVNFSEDESTTERQNAIKKITSTLADQVNSILNLTGGNLESLATLKITESAKRGGGLIRLGVGSSGDEATQGRGFKSVEDLLGFGIGEVFSKGRISGVDQRILDVITKSSRMGSNSEEILQDVLLAKSVFEDAAQSVSPLKQALDELDDAFKVMKERATALGIPLEKINDQYDRQKNGIIQEALAPLQDFLDSQALSSTSSLSAVERLSLARSAFDENLSAINSGDLTGINNITGQASTLLSLGRDVFASGEGFNALESFVRQSITGIAGSLGAEGGLNDSISREISLSNAQQTSILEQMNARIEELREENRKLRKSMERVGNAVVQMVS